MNSVWTKMHGVYICREEINVTLPNTCTHTNPYLQAVTSLGLPDTRGLVRGSGEHAAALRVEGHLRDLPLMTRQDRVTRS